MSWILGAYIQDIAIPGFNFISGKRLKHGANHYEYHAWLAPDKLCVDVTADQFVDGPSKIIVTQPSEWHSEFEPDNLRIADFRFHSRPEPELMKTLEIAKLAIEKQSRH